jgi:bisphosphoglycerate-independent phosphoglycerate mutase (AlkP superfamily)
MFSQAAFIFAPTLNPVPFIVYDPHDVNNQKIKLDQHPENGLSKIAGTALQLMELSKPAKDFETLIQK